MTESNSTALTTQAPPTKMSLIENMAHEYGMEAKPFYDAIIQTVMPGNASTAQVAAFLQVAHEYNLNPFIREIYAFPTKGGGIQPVVSVDGWIYKITSHPQFAGVEDPVYKYDDKGKIVSCTITAHRKDWESAITVTEWFDECYRNTEPWNKMPHRMMRNRTMCQVGRIGFGIHGLMTPDEAEEINITAESTVMERATETKTEALKEKLQAKKEASKKAEEPKAPVAPPPPPPPPVEEVPPPCDPETGEIVEPTREEKLTALHNGVNELFDIKEEEKKDEGDRLLTDAERQRILDVLKTKATTPEQKSAVEKAARQKFMSYGAGSTKMLLFKDYEPILEWARNLKV